MIKILELYVDNVEGSDGGDVKEYKNWNDFMIFWMMERIMDDEREIKLEDGGIVDEDVLMDCDDDEDRLRFIGVVLKEDFENDIEKMVDNLMGGSDDELYGYEYDMNRKEIKWNGDEGDRYWNVLS
jgi:hypothetical protein